MFIDGARFGASAEACGQYLAKGRTIAVTGRHIYREVGGRRRHPPLQAPTQRTRRFGGHPDDAPTNSEDAADRTENAF